MDECKQTTSMLLYKKPLCMPQHQTHRRKWHHQHSLCAHHNTQIYDTLFCLFASLSLSIANISVLLFWNHKRCYFIPQQSKTGGYWLQQKPISFPLSHTITSHCVHYRGIDVSAITTLAQMVNTVTDTHALHRRNHHKFPTPVLIARKTVPRCVCVCAVFSEYVMMSPSTRILKTIGITVKAWSSNPPLF